jgi:hypothetical protein
MDKVFIFTSLVFMANFFMGLAGKGFSSYATGFGIKGFIHNVHLLTGLQMCLVYYILRKIKPRKKIIRILFYTGNTAISFLMGTKTAVIQAFLISFIDFYFSLGKRSKQIVRWFLPVLIGGIVYLLVIFIPQTNFYMNVEKRILSKIGTDNLVNIFLSGRLTQQQFWHSQYIDDISISTIFFGMGYMGGKPMSIPMEIDFFFTLYFCGIIVLAMTLFFYIRLIYFCLQKKKNYQLFYFNILYFFMSLTSGYVWMNVLSGVFFSYINAYELSRKK